MSVSRFVFSGVLVSLLSLSGCGGTDDVPEDRISIGEFREAVRDAAVGASSLEVFFCGEVQLGTSPTAVNTCVSDSFILNRPFYAFYQEQGSGSSQLAGVSMNSEGLVRIWNYNGSGSGSISSVSCDEPVFSSNPEASFEDLITCADG